MAKGSVAKVVNKVAAAMRKHSPEILTGLGIAGMLTTTFLAVKATPKALQQMEEMKEELYPLDDENNISLTPVETVKACWKCYVPAVITGAVSTACLIGATNVSVRRHAALTAAYALSESSLREYQEKVIETIGEKKERTVRDAIDKDTLKKNPVSNSDVIMTGKGGTLCYDPHGNRYFESDIEKIKRAMIEVNYQILREDYASLNDFYYELGLDGTELGQKLGWKAMNGAVDLLLGAQIADDDRPCIVIRYTIAPTYDFDRFG